MFQFMWKVVFWSCLLRYTLSETNGKLEGKCSEEWTYNGGSCYFIFNRAISWYSAKTKCEDNFSSLAKISSITEHKFVLKMMNSSRHKKGNFDYTWIGLKRCQKDSSKFCWTDGSETGFAPRNRPWKDFQPNNNPIYGGQACVAQQMNTGLWNDKKCSEYYMTLCERVLPSVQHSITNISSESAVVHWKITGPSSGIFSYRVMLRAVTEQIVFQTNSTYMKLEQLQQGTRYEVQVQAVSWAGSGMPSIMRAFRTAGNGSKPEIKQLIAVKPIKDSDGTKDEDISLFCEAVGILPFNFTWRRNGKEIEKQSEIQQTSIQLRIHPNFKETAATYECVAENKRGVARKSITLSDSLWNVGEPDDESEEKLIQGMLALYLAIGCGLLTCLVIILITIVVLMCRRMRYTKNASSVGEDARLGLRSPSSSPTRMDESELDSLSEDGSQELDQNGIVVPIYQSPILGNQSPSESTSKDRKGDVKYHYAYDHTTNAKARLSAIASHTYINDSQVSLDKPKPRETGSERFCPVNDFVTGQRHYVNTSKSLPERSSDTEDLTSAFGRNQKSLQSGLMTRSGGNLFGGKHHYVNNSEFSNRG